MGLKIIQDKSEPVIALDLTVGTLFKGEINKVQSIYLRCTGVLVDLENPLRVWTGDGLVAVVVNYYQEIDANLVRQIE